MKLVWRYSLIVTIPLVFASLLLAFNTWQLFTEVGIRQIGDRGLPRLSLRQAATIEFDKLTRKFYPIRESIIFASGFKHVSLYAKESSLDYLNHDLPESAQEYVPALMMVEDEIYDGSLRYRGDFHIHWAFPKKSFRFKTKRKKTYEGIRHLNLIVPKTQALLNNYLGYEVARLLGLIAPHSELVTVTVNGEYQGIYLLAEQVREGLLRKHEVIPGDIFSGDQIFGADKWVGIDSKLFSHPGLWDKAAIYNKLPEDNFASLERLLTAIQDPRQPAPELLEMIDVDAFARFSAMEMLLSTGHHDQKHNWKLFFDPIKRRFIPIVWDSFGWNDEFVETTWPNEVPPVDVVASELMIALYQFRAFHVERQRVIDQFFADELDASVLQLLNQTAEKIQPLIPAERTAVDGYYERVTPDSHARALAVLRQRVSATFSRARATYLSRPDIAYSVKDARSVVIEADGRALADGLIVEFDAPVTATSATISWVEGDGALQSASAPLSDAASNARVEIDFPFLTGIRLTMQDPATPVTVEPQYYVVQIEHDVADTKITNVFSVDGSPAVYEATMPPATGQVAHLVEAPTLERWAGEIRIEQDMIVDRDVTIAAGSRIVLGPDINLEFRGRVTATGTPQNPISYEPLVSGAPWGTIVIRGEASSGSTLEHFIVSGGSQQVSDVAVVSGMFSVYEVQDIRISHCLIKDNQIGDDQLHMVYSSGLIEHCRFQNAFMDALDVDLGEIIVRDSEFVASGNDGVDLMGASAMITRTSFSDNGDKGISIGEGSEAEVFENEFYRNFISIEVKDGSRAMVSDNRIEGNGTALNLYKKNWRYGAGGNVAECRNHYQGNDQHITADKHSSVEVCQ